MKKILLTFLGILLLCGCTNKNMHTYYENTKAGGKIDSYQIDLRIYGNYDGKTYNESVRIDNYKGKQVKVNSVKKDMIVKENESEYIGNNEAYKINDKYYEYKDGKYEEVSTLIYSNPNVYLEGLTKAKKVEELNGDTIGDIAYKTYKFRISKSDMKSILKDGILKDLNLKSDATAKIWIDKNNRVFKVVYYLIEGNDRVEINASIFRINTISDMSNAIK